MRVGGLAQGVDGSAKLLDQVIVEAAVALQAATVCERNRDVEAKIRVGFHAVEVSDGIGPRHSDFSCRLSWRRYSRIGYCC